VQNFQLFCKYSLLTTPIVRLRHLCKIQIPKGTATRVSNFTHWLSKNHRAGKHDN